MLLDKRLFGSTVISFSSLSIPNTPTALLKRELFDLELEGNCTIFSPTSDIVPSVYEGGLKVWECTRDLLAFLAGQNFSGKRILDLGCGSGLLGIFCLVSSGSDGCFVDFHDYNQQVLEHFTIPNALMNLSCGSVLALDADAVNREFEIDQSRIMNTLQNTNFYFGDWTDFTPVSPLYDVILSCETIYSPCSYEKIARVLQKYLEPTQGVAYLAAKKYYFGCGGSGRVFGEFLGEFGGFEVKLLLSVPASVPREIWEIRKTQKVEAC